MAEKLILTDEQLTVVSDLAANNYSPEKIALYLEVDKKQFMRAWYNHASEIRIAYDRGQLEAEFLINNKQLELAKAGNITAAQIFLKEQENTKINNIRNSILFGHEE